MHEDLEGRTIYLISNGDISKSLIPINSSTDRSTALENCSEIRREASIGFLDSNAPAMKKN
jgi:hypothetical protein